MKGYIDRQDHPSYHPVKDAIITYFKEKKPLEWLLSEIDSHPYGYINAVMMVSIDKNEFPNYIPEQKIVELHHILLNECQRFGFTPYHPKIKRKKWWQLRKK